MQNSARHFHLKLLQMHDYQSPSVSKLTSLPSQSPTYISQRTQRHPVPSQFKLQMGCMSKHLDVSMLLCEIHLHHQNNYIQALLNH